MFRLYRFQLNCTSAVRTDHSSRSRKHCYQQKYSLAHLYRFQNTRITRETSKRQDNVIKRNEYIFVCRKVPALRAVSIHVFYSIFTLSTLVYIPWLCVCCLRNCMGGPPSPYISLAQHKRYCRRLFILLPTHKKSKRKNDLKVKFLKIMRITLRVLAI